MCAPPLFYLYHSTNNPMLGLKEHYFAEGEMLYNNAVIPDVCTHWQERIHQDLLKEDALRPLPGFTCLLWRTSAVCVGADFLH